MSKLEHKITGRKVLFLQSPLALLMLSACGGSGSSSQIPLFTKTGRVIKGPIENAIVGLDYDSDGVIDTSTVMTDASGYYSINTSQNDFTVVVQTTDQSIDHSSGSILSGIKLSAPSNSDVVTLPTHLIVEAGISAVEVKQVLGLDESIDLLSFDPFSETADAALALDYEKTGQQIVAVVNAFAGAAEGAGASEAEAFDAALNSVVEVVKAKATNFTDKNASAADKTLDLTSAADLALVKAEVVTKVAEETNADTTAFDALAEDTVTAVKNVNDKIATVDDLYSEEAKNTFSTTQVLADQTKQAAEAEVQSAGSGTIDFTDTTKVDAAAANKAPTDITLSKSAIAEDASSLVIGTLTTTDSDQTSGVLHTYNIAELAGTDYAAFSINAATGELSFKAQPNFEAKSSYTITILSTDEGGKTYSKSFTISVTDANEAPTLSVPTGGSVIEDASTSEITGSLSSSDPEGDTPTYAVVGETASDGSYTVTGTYGTLTLNASTGAYTYALNNSASAVQALGASDSKTESFSVQVTDGTNTPAAQTLSFTIQGANDAPSAPNLDNSSIEENVAGDTVGTLSTTDADGDGVSYEIGSGGDGASFEVDGTTLKLKDSVTADREAKGSYTVTVNADDGTDSKSSTFTISVTDANEAPTLSVPTGGSVIEDASTSEITGSLSSSDPEGDTPTYAVVGETASDGSYTVTGTYGTLTLNASTGAYTYALNNSASAVQALGASDSKTESFSVQVTDGTNTPAAQALSFTIQGTDDNIGSVILLGVAEKSQGVEGKVVASVADIRNIDQSQPIQYTWFADTQQITTASTSELIISDHFASVDGKKISVSVDYYDTSGYQKTLVSDTIDYGNFRIVVDAEGGSLAGDNPFPLIESYSFNGNSSVEDGGVKYSASEFHNITSVEASSLGIEAREGDNVIKIFADGRNSGTSADYSYRSELDHSDWDTKFVSGEDYYFSGSFFLQSQEWGAVTQYSTVITQFKQYGGGDPNFELRLSNLGDYQLQVRGKPHSVDYTDVAVAEYDTWNDLKLYMKHSEGADGLFKVWLNGSLIYDYRGATMYKQDQGGYLKFGMYTQIHDEREILWDAVEISDFLNSDLDTWLADRDHLPTIETTGIVDGQQYASGASLDLTGTASDPSGNKLNTAGSIDKVELFVNDALVATSTNAEFAFSNLQFSDGANKVFLRAHDNDGNTTDTEIYDVWFGNKLPTAAMSNEGKLIDYDLGDTIGLAVTASDPDGQVQDVSFYANGDLIGAGTNTSSSTYELSWQPATKGMYEVEARVTDDEGGLTTTNSTHVAVSDVVNQIQVSSDNDASIKPNDGTYTGNFSTVQVYGKDTDPIVSLIEFDLSDNILDAGGIRDAQLGIYVSDVREGTDLVGKFSVFSADNSNWDEETVTSASAPNKNAILDTIEITVENQYVYFDVTDAIRTAHASSADRVTFWLEDATTDDNWEEVKFDSHKKSNQPVLDIDIGEFPLLDDDILWVSDVL